MFNANSKPDSRANLEVTATDNSINAQKSLKNSGFVYTGKTPDKDIFVTLTMKFKLDAHTRLRIVNVNFKAENAHHVGYSLEEHSQTTLKADDKPIVLNSASVDDELERSNLHADTIKIFAKPSGADNTVTIYDVYVQACMEVITPTTASTTLLLPDKQALKSLNAEMKRLQLAMTPKPVHRGNATHPANTNTINPNDLQALKNLEAEIKRQQLALTPKAGEPVNAAYPDLIALKSLEEEAKHLQLQLAPRLRTGFYTSVFKHYSNC